MRILYISHGGDREGAPIALLNLIKEMIKAGIDVGVTIPIPEGWFYEQIKSIGVKIFYMRGYPKYMSIPSQKKGLELLQWYYKFSRIILGVHKDIYKIIKEFKPDIVHTNTSAIDYGLLGCFLTRTPHVWHFRELLDEGCNMKVFPGKTIFKAKQKLSFNHNIAITKAVYKYYNMTAKDHVIYDGVIDSSQPMVKPANLGFNYFLCVGYIDKNKGTKETIFHFCEFTQTNTDIHLILAGGFNTKDDYYSSCQRMTQEYGIEERVHFLGPRTDVYELMSGAKALIVNSSFEGFGFAMTEAMYNNCLVIGKDTGGTKEQFDNGWAETGSEIGLRFADAKELPNLFKLALTEDFSEMKKNAQRVVLNNYTTQKNALEMLNLYKNLIK